MAFRKISTGEYPVNHDRIRIENPNVSFPAWFTEANGFEWVEPISQPSFDHEKQYLEEGAPVKIDGVWKQVWVIKDFDAETISSLQAGRIADMSLQVRSERNRKLSASDWTQLADSTADKAAWGAYRQALRDVPSQPGFPWTIDWPVAP